MWSFIEWNHFTFMKVCTLLEGSGIVSGDTLERSGRNEMNVSGFEVIGPSLTHVVRISRLNVVLLFRNSFVNATSVMTISGSTMHLVLSGHSLFHLGIRLLRVSSHSCKVFEINDSIAFTSSRNARPVLLTIDSATSKNRGPLGELKIRSISFQD
jgi:hypothetical protein